jgi:hypothetical protein
MTTDQPYFGVLLDRSKPFGKVHGTIGPGEPHYHQDGLPFDAHGNLLAAGLTADQVTLAERKARRAKRRAPREERAEGAAAVAAGELDDEDVADSDPGDVNLEAWLRGDAKYLFDAVRTAIRARYTRDCKSIGDAVEFLVFEENLVDRKTVSQMLLPK